MTATLSFKIRTIKNQIAACLREIARGVKSFIDRLVVLEGTLETLEKLKEEQPMNREEIIQKLIELDAKLNQLPRFAFERTQKQFDEYNQLDSAYIQFFKKAKKEDREYIRNQLKKVNAYRY